MREKVLEFVTTHVGCQTPDIVRQLNIPPAEACKVVRELLAEGVLIHRQVPHYHSGKVCPCLVRP
jgi:hypothetical protein